MIQQQQQQQQNINLSIKHEEESKEEDYKNIDLKIEPWETYPTSITSTIIRDIQHIQQQKQNQKQRPSTTTSHIPSSPHRQPHPHSPHRPSTTSYQHPTTTHDIIHRMSDRWYDQIQSQQQTPLESRCHSRHRDREEGEEQNQQRSRPSSGSRSRSRSTEFSHASRLSRREWQKQRGLLFKPPSATDDPDPQSRDTLGPRVHSLTLSSTSPSTTPVIVPVLPSASFMSVRPPAGAVHFHETCINEGRLQKLNKGSSTRFRGNGDVSQRLLAMLRLSRNPKITSWRTDTNQWMTKLQKNAPRELTGTQLEEIRSLFEVLDVDGSGTIDVSELTLGMRVYGFRSNARQVAQKMCQQLGLSARQGLTFAQFASVVVNAEIPRDSSPSSPGRPSSSSAPSSSPSPLPSTRRSGTTSPAKHEKLFSRMLHGQETDTPFAQTITDFKRKRLLERMMNVTGIQIPAKKAHPHPHRSHGHVRTTSRHHHTNSNSSSHSTSSSTNEGATET